MDDAWEGGKGVVADGIGVLVGVGLEFVRVGDELAGDGVVGG